MLVLQALRSTITRIKDHFNTVNTESIQLSTTIRGWLPVWFQFEYLLIVQQSFGQILN